MIYNKFVANADVMKRILVVCICFIPWIGQSQNKELVFSELTAGSGMFLGAVMTTTDITVTVQGPSDRYLAFGFGTGMATGNDAIIWSTLGTGAAPLQLRDHRMIGQGNEPSVDAQQDWTVVSNTVNAGNRTIVLTRALNTGDANDVTFNFSATTQNLFWAKSASASNQLVYHGASNRASGIVRNWVVQDVVPPILNTITPADNANGVSLTTNVTMAFSENVSWGTGSFRIYDGNNNLIQTVSSGDPNVTITGASVFYNPPTNLVLNTNYYIQIDATAFKDGSNNFYLGINDNTTWNFNTNDVSPPSVVGAFVPSDNATNVATNTPFSITFNEPVQIGTGVITLFTGTSIIVETFNSAAITLSAGNTVATFNASSALLEMQPHYLHIPSGFFQDLSGNPYVGFTNNTSWNFVVGDFTAPTIASVTPTDNAVNVPLNSQIEVNFNEVVTIGTGSLFLKNESTGVEIQFSSALGNITSGASSMTLDLPANLVANSNYHVVIDNNFVADASSNAFVGLTDTTAWTFSTISTAGVFELSQQDYCWNNEQLEIYPIFEQGEVLDMSGRVVRKLTTQVTQLSDLPAGVYTIRLVMNTTLATLKIYVH